MKLLQALISYFKGLSINAILLDSRKQEIKKRLLSAMQSACSERIQRDRERGMKERLIRCHGCRYSERLGNRPSSIHFPEKPWLRPGINPSHKRKAVDTAGVWIFWIHQDCSGKV